MVDVSRAQLLLGTEALALHVTGEDNLSTKGAGTSASTAQRVTTQPRSLGSCHTATAGSRDHHLDASHSGEASMQRRVRRQSRGTPCQLRQSASWPVVPQEESVPQVALIEALLLAFPDPQHPFILDTDASNMGLLCRAVARGGAL